MAYKYGKTFKKDGKLVRYRYTDGVKSTKKLVAVNKKKTNHLSSFITYVRDVPRSGLNELGNVSSDLWNLSHY